MRRLIDLTGLGRHPRTVARLGAGRLAVAVGGINGNVDCVVNQHQKILQQTQNASQQHRLVIYMGGFVGNAQTADTIDLLLSAPLHGFFKICLAGEQEKQLWNFLHWEQSDFAADSSCLNWLKTKEAALTLNSYGIKRGGLIDLVRAKELYSALTSVIPQDHVEFLSSLRTTYHLGDFVFSCDRNTAFGKMKTLITIDEYENIIGALNGEIAYFNKCKHEHTLLFLQDKS